MSKPSTVKNPQKLDWADASQNLCKYGVKCTNKHCRFEHEHLVAASTKSVMKQKSQSLEGLSAAVRTVLDRKTELRKKADEFERKYVLVTNQKDLKSDSKVENPYSDAMKLCEVELAQLRQAARSLMGPMKVYKINLPEALIFNSGASNNAMNVYTVDPTGLTEFASLATLFDEFRVTGGEYCFSLCDWSPATVNMLGFGALAYDPANGTLPTSEVLVMQAQQAKMVFYGVVLAGAGGLTVTHTGGQTFKYKVPAGVLVPAGATASEGTSNWQPTYSTNGFQPYGWLKYAKQNVHASTAQTSGISVLHCEFRSRE